MTKKALLFCLIFTFFVHNLPASPVDTLSINKNRTDKISSCLKKGDALILKESDSALFYYKKAEFLAIKSHLKKPLVATYQSLGDFYFKTGNLDSAQYYYQQTIHLSKTNDYLNGEINAKSGMGAIYFYKADYPKALKWYYDALHDFDHYNNDTLKAAVLNKLAGVFYKLKDYSKALTNLHQSLKLKEKIGDSLALSKTYNNLGNVYADLKKYDTALYYYKKDLEISTKNKNLFNVAISNTNIASVYREMGNYNQALEHIHAALKIDSAANDLYGIAADYTELYYVYFDLKRYNKAKAYMLEALDIARNIHADDIELTVLKDLSNFYEKTGNHQKALSWYKKQAALKDSILNDTKNKQIIDAEKKYETQKKNMEIQQLKLEKIEYKSRLKIYLILTISLILIIILLFVFFKQRVKTNKLLNEKNEHLKQLNDTQNRLMSIISHDLKAPLSAFYSITVSLKSKLNKLSNEETDHYLGRMLNSAVALKLQLENMLNWAITQQKDISVSKNLYNLNLLISKTVIILQEFANEKNIRINVEIDENLEIKTDGRLLSIAINNLVSNAVKFSFPDSKILISATKVADHILISIKDFGKGMDENEIKHLFAENQNSVQSETGTGLGLIVTKDILKKLGGKIWVKSQSGKGTEILIEL